MKSADLNPAKPKRPLTNWHDEQADTLTLGQRSADKLRNWMGSWVFIAGFLLIMIVWAIMNGTGIAWDPYPFILLNLFLSMLAGLQGAILLIAAKRQDGIAAAISLCEAKWDTRAMGYFVFSNVAEYEVEDRALAHLKLAIAYKLRRQESFFVTWSKPLEKGSGSVSAWVSPYIPIAFRFAGSRPPEINPLWVESLKQLAQTPRGLILISEKEAEEHMRNNPITGV